MSPLEESDIAFRLGELVSGQKLTHSGLHDLTVSVAALKTEVTANSTEIANLKQSTSDQWSKLNDHIDDTACVLPATPQSGKETAFAMPKMTVKTIAIIVSGAVVGLGAGNLTLWQMMGGK